MTIKNLINRFFEEAKRGKDAFRRNMALAEELKRQGPRVVDSILDELFARKAAGTLRYSNYSLGSPVFHLIKVATELAQPQHAQRLAEMLLWEEIGSDRDRSVRGCLLEALRRISDVRVIPFLQELAEKVKGIQYTDYHEPPSDHSPTGVFIPAFQYNQWDQKEIAKTITACKR